MSIDHESNAGDEKPEDIHPEGENMGIWPFGPTLKDPAVVQSEVMGRLAQLGLPQRFAATPATLGELVLAVATYAQSKGTAPNALQQFVAKLTPA
jgi:hypothetical protein